MNSFPSFFKLFYHHQVDQLETAKKTNKQILIVRREWQCLVIKKVLVSKIFLFSSEGKEIWIDKGKCPHLTCGKRVILVL